MTILQADPVSVLPTCHYQIPCDFALTLTQRQHLQPRVHLFFLGQSYEIGYRIGTRRQDKDDGRGRGGVMERSFQIKDRRLNESFSKNIEDEILDEQNQFLSS